MKIEFFMIFLILATLLLGQSPVEAGTFPCGKRICVFGQKCVDGVCIKWNTQTYYIISSYNNF